MQRIKNFFNFRELFLKMLDENYRIKSFNTFKMFLFKKYDFLFGSTLFLFVLLSILQNRIGLASITVRSPVKCF